MARRPLASWLLGATNPRVRLSREDEEHMSGELLEGTPAASVIDRWIQLGRSPIAVRRAAAAIAQSPLMPVAKIALLRLTSRDWQNSQSAKLDRFTEIAPLRRELSQEVFLRDFVYTNRPVHLPAAALGWPAIDKWTDEYLKHTCGSAEVAVMQGRVRASPAAQYSGSQLSTRMTFGTYVDMVAHGGPTNDYYLVAKNDFFDSTETRRLLSDIRPMSVLPLPDSSDIKLWFGPMGTKTPLHHDSRSTLLVQIRGRKRFSLIPPPYSAKMRQTEFGYAGDNCDQQHLRDGSVCARTLELAPGDVLFVPVGWWHEVEALEVSISISLINMGHFIDPDAVTRNDAIEACETPAGAQGGRVLCHEVVSTALSARRKAHGAS